MKLLFPLILLLLLCLPKTFWRLYSYLGCLKYIGVLGKPKNPPKFFRVVRFHPSWTPMSVVVYCQFKEQGWYWFILSSFSFFFEPLTSFASAQVTRATCTSHLCYVASKHLTPISIFSLADVKMNHVRGSGAGAQIRASHSQSDPVSVGKTTPLSISKRIEVSSCFSLRPESCVVGSISAQVICRALLVWLIWYHLILLILAVSLHVGLTDKVNRNQVISY